MKKPPSDPSVRFEPQFADEGGGAAFRRASHQQPAPSSEPEPPIPAATPQRGGPPEGSVWEEPAISAETAGPAPRDAPTYGRWLEESRDRVADPTTWIVTGALAILAGPWAVLGAFLGMERSSSGLFLVVIFGPVMEEVLKVSAPLIVVERRPSLFRSPAQLLICAFSSGLLFAAIENVLYLEVYIPDPEPDIIWWRWTACVALHSGCSLIAGIGIARVWRDVWERKDRPRLQLAVPYIVAAAVIHGIYNAFATAWTVVRHGGN